MIQKSMTWWWLLALWVAASLLWSSCAAYGEPFGTGTTHYRGCARGHGLVTACDYCMQYNALYHAQRHAQVQVMHDAPAAAMSHVAHKLPAGIRMDATHVRSPYSDYVVTSAHVLPGHIVTDHAIVPKRNFVIPK